MVCLAPFRDVPRSQVGLSLFWRTAAFLTALLLGALVAWTFVLRALDAERSTPTLAAQVSSAIALVRPLLADPDDAQRNAVEQGKVMPNGRRRCA